MLEKDRVTVTSNFTPSQRYLLINTNYKIVNVILNPDLLSKQHCIINVCLIIVYLEPTTNYEICRFET